MVKELLNNEYEVKDDEGAVLYENFQIMKEGKTMVYENYEC